MLSVLERIENTDATQQRLERCDERFAQLMGQSAWQALAPDVQRRFSKMAHGGESKIYKGIISETRMSVAGYLLAQMCRVIGGPLPLERHGVGMPAVVTVTEDGEGDGQFWTRTYGQARGFPQVIHSSKRFTGPTGLEEYIGAGISMALNVTEDKAGIVFTSASYHINVLGRRITLPKWLMPGVTNVRHDDLGEGYFAFTLELRHPLLGELVYQRAVFSDTGPRQRK